MQAGPNYIKTANIHDLYWIEYFFQKEKKSKRQSF